MEFVWNYKKLIIFIKNFINILKKKLNYSVKKLNFQNFKKKKINYFKNNKILLLLMILY